MPRSYCSHRCFSVDGASLRGHADFCSAVATAHYAPSLVIEPVDLRVELSIDIATKHLVGKVYTLVVAHAEGADTLELNALHFEKVATVVDVTESVPENPITWRYDGMHIFVRWAHPLSLNEHRRFLIEYSISDPVSGLLFSRPDDLVPDRPVFAITDHETERARYWLPCVDFPAVRTTFELLITCPAFYSPSHPLVIVGPGERISHTVTNGPSALQTAHFRLAFPCPSYLFCFAVGCFVTVADTRPQTPQIPVHYYGVVGGAAVGTDGRGRVSEEADRAALMRTFSETPAMLTWLVGKLGVKFPFDRYQQIVVPHIGGAMENITLVTWDDVFLLGDEAFSEERAWVVNSINVHEMAHSYFGDAVVIRHFEHAWLKESWATYIEAVWREDSPRLGRSEFYLELFEQAQDYFDECEVYVRPIVTRRYDHSWKLFDMHLYPGGSWRLHMLRRMLGDAVFWAGVKDYLEMFSLKTVETDDFRRCLERAAGGVNLTQFFDEWIYSATGFPKIKVSKLIVSAEKTAVVVEQTQTSHVFTMDVEIEFVFLSGERRIGTARFLRGSRTAEAAVAMPTQGLAVTALRIDPNHKVLFQLVDLEIGEDVIGGTLLLDRSDGPAKDDVISRIWMVLALAKLSTKSAIDRIAEAMRSEPFYGVRLFATGALAKSKSAHAVSTLVDMLARETHPRVLESIMVAFSNIRDPVVHKTLREYITQRLEQGKLAPYRAFAEALVALGSQRDTTDLPLLIRAFDAGCRASFHGTVAGGAARGIGRLRTSVEGLDFLLVRASPQGAAAHGVEERVRPSIVTAIGEAALWLGKADRARAEEQLVDLLRDSDDRVRTAAISALVMLGATAAVGDISATKPLFSEQVQVWVEQQATKLEKAAKEPESGAVAAAEALKKDVEDLQAKVRQLWEEYQKKETKP